MENSPIQFKTESTAGDGHYLNLYFQDDDESDAGDIYITFEDPIKYELYGCNSNGVAFTELPAEVEKVWTFTLSREDGERRVVIHCNDKEVLNVVLSDTTCDIESDDWRDYWNLDVTELEIMANGKAETGLYRPGSCLKLKTVFNHIRNTCIIGHDNHGHP